MNRTIPVVLSALQFLERQVHELSLQGGGPLGSTVSIECEQLEVGTELEAIEAFALKGQTRYGNVWVQRADMVLDRDAAGMIGLAVLAKAFDGKGRAVRLQAPTRLDSSRTFNTIRISRLESQSDDAGFLLQPRKFAFVAGDWTNTQWLLSPRASVPA